MAKHSEQVDLRQAINAVSDVVQNRPRPLREFDQIYMKTGDMVFQSEAVASWADGKGLAFIGDGDAISVSVAYLQERGVLGFGPSKITVFDFRRADSRCGNRGSRTRRGSRTWMRYSTTCWTRFPRRTSSTCSTRIHLGAHRTTGKVRMCSFREGWRLFGTPERD